MSDVVDLTYLECADDNPKIITRRIHFVMKSYLVDICNDCSKKEEFQGEDTLNLLKDNEAEKSAGENV